MHGYASCQTGRPECWPFTDGCRHTDARHFGSHTTAVTKAGTRRTRLHFVSRSTIVSFLGRVFSFCFISKTPYAIFQRTMAVI